MNASPDLRFQIEANPELQPSKLRGRRNTPIQSIILTSADLDQVLGLLLLREFQPLHLYATPLVRQVLEANSFFRMLQRIPNQLTWTPIIPGVPFHLPGGITCMPKSMPGSLPFYAKEVDIAAPRQASLGLVFESGGIRLAYTPSLPEITADLLTIYDSSDVILVDGTFWSDAELSETHSGTPLARSIGHLPMSGVDGTLALLKQVKAPRKVFIHINNTNPVLDPRSEEYKQVIDAGWEIGHDGWQLKLATPQTAEEPTEQPAEKCADKRAESAMLTRQELHDRLRAVGAARYHHRHPFHLRMHKGELTRGQLQAWALNRYYYQSRIPIKDALLLAKSDDPAFRRAWRKRIVDHDGDADGYGGVEKWIQLAQATGVERDYVVSGKGLLPGVIFAVDAYLALVRDSSLLVAVASSLTELFSRDLISLRMDQMRIHYPYLVPGLAYFEGRLTQAPEDAAFALDYVSTHAETRAEQEQVIRALERKCEILWAQLDAIDYAYVQPGNIPPGCFVPEADAS